MTIEIHLSGPAGTGLAGEAEELLRSISGVAPERREIPDDDQTVKGEALAWITLVFTIPSGILAAMDLAARLDLVERIRKFLQKVRKTEGQVTLVAGEEPPLDLKTAADDRVVEALEKTSTGNREPS